MNINPKKTKVVIFEKKYRKSTGEKYSLFISDNTIEIVNNYAYLGVNFSTYGSFRNHKTKAEEKTRRSIFATRRYLDFSQIVFVVKVLIHCLLQSFSMDQKYGDL